jgi:acetyltransferase-like isoleucine patch superfamily enzyme
MDIAHFILDRFRSALMSRSRRALRSLGNGVEIQPSVRFVFPEHIEIGDHVYIGPGSYLNGRGGLAIGDHVIMAPDVAIMTSMHRFRDAEMVPYDQVETLRPVRIGRCVWLGMRAMVLPGVEIGEGSIVGAGAVVTKSIPSCSIVAGNPARVIGTRDAAHYRRCIEEGRFYFKLKQAQGFSKIETLTVRRTSA